MKLTPPLSRPIRALFGQASGCWNWKCALMSAVVRSLVLLVAMAHGNLPSCWAVIAVEMGYVTLTAGLWAGLQQRALGLRQKLVGNLLIVVAVPGASLLFDFLAHRLAGANAPAHASVAVCAFALVSALFHLHVMRHGAFLTGQGRTLVDDFRRMPGLIAGFVLRPVALLQAGNLKLPRNAAREVAY